MKAKVVTTHRHRRRNRFGRCAAVLMISAVLVSACTGPSRSLEHTGTASPSPSAKDQRSSGPDTSQLQLPPRIFSGVMPLDPQPAANRTAPGLAVVYFRGFFSRHLDALPQGEFARQVGRPGKPISYIDHDFGKGEVFDSGEKRGVGLRMTGLIRFDRAGSFTFRAMANDGIRVTIGDRRIIDDPEWHRYGDRYTVPAVVEVSRPGWYSIEVEYFQRKGTGVIRLHWQPPGAAAFDRVPAEVLAHVPETAP
jgi:hypothetical protein